MTLSKFQVFMIYFNDTISGSQTKRLAVFTAAEYHILQTSLSAMVHYLLERAIVGAWQLRVQFS